MSNFVEDVGINLQVQPTDFGPVVRYTDKVFSVNFDGGGVTSLTSQVPIVHPTAATLGEEKRVWLHASLDRFLDLLLTTGSGRPPKGVA